MRKIYWAIFSGNCFTKYNQALFSLLAPTWAASFSTSSDPITNLIIAYSVLATDWIARPLGAWFWGWLADRDSIPKALLYSLSGVTLLTTCLGLLPTLSTSNDTFFMLMFTTRLVYSFFATGETTNGAMLLLEHSHSNRHNWINSFYDASSMLGSLLATIMVFVFSRIRYLQHQWCWLFYLNSFLCGVTLILRSTMTNKTDKINRKAVPSISIKTIFGYHWVKLIALMSASGFTYATYLFSFVLVQGYIPLVVDTINYEHLLIINSLLICFDIILLPIFAKLANIWGYRFQMVGSSVLMVLSTPFLFYCMEQATIIAIFCARIWTMVLGVAFSCTYHVWAKSLLQGATQCRLAALGYTLGSRLIGMPILVVGLWLFQQTALIGAPVLYLSFTAMTAGIAVYYTQPSNSFNCIKRLNLKNINNIH